MKIKLKFGNDASLRRTSTGGNMDDIAGETEAMLRTGTKSIGNVIDFLKKSPGVNRPRVVSKVSDVYSYERSSQWVFDFAMRSLMNFGNWTMSVAAGIQAGFWAFQSSRYAFRKKARLRPPIHVSATEAKADMERLFVEEKIIWKE